ncbi:type I-F CRISPR-associated helicase Cas3, partial [Vibrio anguillarum]|nr:type I-F CRISPR-associated helicase Cas3 [Vibrio anguillarum]
EQADAGSESLESLQDESDEVRWQGVLPEEELTTILSTDKGECQKYRALLYAPVLVCTIDHIMAATETKRGGRYILPCLRLMSSDLVIDEIDDFTGDDLIAIGRLVHLAGMLGRKVMIS